MLVDIREVKRCRNNACGNCLPRGRGKQRYWVITLSTTENKTLAEWASTLLHELLHVWVTAIRLRGFKVTGIKEHKFIYEAEEAICSVLRYLKPKKRKKQ